MLINACAHSKGYCCGYGVVFALVYWFMLAGSTSKTASTGWPTTCLRKTNSINTQKYTQLVTSYVKSSNKALLLM